MAYVITDIPDNVPFYDPADGAVKQAPGYWCILHDTLTKIYAIDPGNTINKAWLTPGSMGGYRRIGYSGPVAGLIAWAMNNPAT